MQFRLSEENRERIRTLAEAVGQTQGPFVVNLMNLYESLVQEAKRGDRDALFLLIDHHVMPPLRKD